MIIARRGKPVAELVQARRQGLPFGVAIKEPLVPPGDVWWQPLTDEEADEWMDAR